MGDFVRRINGIGIVIFDIPPEPKPGVFTPFPLIRYQIAVSIIPIHVDFSRGVYRPEIIAQAVAAVGAVPCIRGFYHVSAVTVDIVGQRDPGRQYAECGIYITGRDRVIPHEIFKDRFTVEGQGRKDYLVTTACFFIPAQPDIGGQFAETYGIGEVKGYALEAHIVEKILHPPDFLVTLGIFSVINKESSLVGVKVLGGSVSVIIIEAETYLVVTAQ